MTTLYTNGKDTFITYWNGETHAYTTIISITYVPRFDRLYIHWDDGSVKEIRFASEAYTSILIPETGNIQLGKCGD